MVENGRKQKEQVYGRLLYCLNAIFSNIIKNDNLFICETRIYINLIIIMLKIISGYN